MRHEDTALLQSLSTTDLKRLLAARERIDELEKERAALETALAKVDQELGRLIAAATAPARPAVRKKPKKTAKKKSAKKKTVKKKTVKKKATKKKAPKKKAAKKPTKKKTTKKKAAKKKATKKKVPTKKAAGRKASAGKSGGNRLTLEDVVVKVLQGAGGTLAYKELFATIVSRKLFASRSANFDNVMRRTLSTSKKIKRVSRGVYGVA